MTFLDARQCDAVAGGAGITPSLYDIIAERTRRTQPPLFPLPQEF